MVIIKMPERINPRFSRYIGKFDREKLLDTLSQTLAERQEG